MSETAEAAVVSAREPGPASAAEAPLRWDPVPRAARIEAMDYLRGLALLGILFINLPVYDAPTDAVFRSELSRWYPAWHDKAAVWLIRFAAESKFYTLLTFLFGVGFGVQLARATGRGLERFAWYY